MGSIQPASSESPMTQIFALLSPISFLTFYAINNTLNCRACHSPSTKQDPIIAAMCKEELLLCWHAIYAVLKTITLCCMVENIDDIYDRLLRQI